MDILTGFDERLKKERITVVTYTYFPKCKSIHFESSLISTLNSTLLKTLLFCCVTFLRSLQSSRFLPFDQVSISKLSKSVSYSSVQHAIKLSFLRKFLYRPENQSFQVHIIPVPMTIEILFFEYTKSARQTIIIQKMIRYRSQVQKGLHNHLSN